MYVTDRQDMTLPVKVALNPQYNQLTIRKNIGQAKPGSNQRPLVFKYCTLLIGPHGLGLTLSEPDT